MCPCLLHCFLLFHCSSLLAGLVLTPCPKGCCCPCPGALVLCESLGLYTLPRSVPLSTSILSVARNRLCNVDNVFQPYSGLQELSLSHNQLARFPRGLPSSLETLQLQENQITYITAGSLRQLGNLTRLDLDDNRIRAIQPGALLRLTRLKMLTLKGNRLSHLPANLPSSLIYLDVSANCISTLDLPSLSALVNLQVLKINSNCLRSIPERAFDGLSRLQSVELANNLWVCECDILYLYRWLLMDRLRMATVLVCTAPLHLAQKLLLTLSVIAICPKLLKPIERMPSVNTTTASGKVVETQVAHTTSASMLNRSDTACKISSLRFQESSKLSESAISSAETLTKQSSFHGNLSRSFFGSDQPTLERLSYEDCLSLNFLAILPQSTQLPYSPATDEDPGCLENSTGQQPGASAIVVSGNSVTPTKEVGLQPELTPQTILQSSDTALIAVLAVLCVFTGFLMLTVLLVLRNVFLRNLRVAPFPQVQGENSTH
ncbi:leucine-rich repeat transmembrane protein FLRT3-like [Myxocyprinus asiaticus]|uniref:leucine-rich repeat transmembrane protein FLRT3-like n=1 Tax=Myxocyprinus asiaticus TaxID=70543 RepID=UPI0022236E56|nr:leucine-rich repeat transmembrane protein FLRT3-like [Myxocyprinus asiaticus]